MSGAAKGPDTIHSLRAALAAEHQRLVEAMDNAEALANNRSTVVRMHAFERQRAETAERALAERDAHLGAARAGLRLFYEAHRLSGPPRCASPDAWREAIARLAPWRKQHGHLYGDALAAIEVVRPEPQP